MRVSRRRVYVSVNNAVAVNKQKIYAFMPEPGGMLHNHSILPDITASPGLYRLAMRVCNIDQCTDARSFAALI